MGSQPRFRSALSGRNPILEFRLTDQPAEGLILAYLQSHKYLELIDAAGMNR